MSLATLPDFYGRRDLYSPLHAGCSTEAQIRILTIEPNPCVGAPLRGSLRTEEVADKPRYAALSYYWGVGIDSDRILVQGTDTGPSSATFEIPVLRVLATALRHFRANTTKPFRIWTDAVCINQWDNKERSIQVALMQQVFERATSVWIWLGANNRWIEQGLVALLSLSIRYGTHAFELEAADLRDESILFPHITNRETQPLDNTLTLMSQITEVFKLPYWSRGYTIQEASLPNKYLHFGEFRCRIKSWLACYDTLLCFIQEISEDIVVGNIRVPGDHLACLRDLSSVPQILEMFIHAEQIGEREQNSSIALYPRHRSPYVSRFSDPRAIDVIQWSAIRTTDPRSIIFALRNLVPAFKSMDADQGDGIQKVFSDATLALLRSARDGWSYNYWLHPSLSPYLPSWANDFTQSDRMQDGDGEIRMLAHVAGCFDASAQSQVQITRLDWRTLQAAGFTFDSIAGISSVNISRDASAVLDWLRAAYGEDIPRETAFSRTISIGQALRHFHNAQMSGPLQSIPDDSILHGGTATGRPADNHTEAAETDRGRQRRSKMAGTAYRVVFTGRSNIGLVPVLATVGDHVAILSSGRMPFILRPVKASRTRGAAYRIIGGCYIDGMARRDA